MLCSYPVPYSVVAKGNLSSMDIRKTSFAIRVRDSWDRRFVSGAARNVYAEILSRAEQTLSLEELLIEVPERVSLALNLSLFHFFLKEGGRYVMQRVSSGSEDALPSFPASSSTVLQMKRERKPVRYVIGRSTGARTGGWQFLATRSDRSLLDSMQTQLLVPLDGRTGLIGFATLAKKDFLPFTPAEIRFLRELGPRVGRALETAQFKLSLAKEAAHRARANSELELAREVQARLLPGELPRLPGLDVAAAYQSAEMVGGDYYDLFVTPSGSYCFAIADVSGKGVSAALLMATLRASLHSVMLEPGLSVPVIVERLNALLHGASSSSRYATLFFCLYDPATSTLSYCNAGHNPPLLRRADGTEIRLASGGTVLGLFSGAAYECASLEWKAGDSLVTWTDGVTEACSPDGEEWGETGLQSALREQASCPADESVRGVLSSLKSFTGRAPQGDDITLVVLNRI
jgi:sigma-B regulation protein RsbU (phosphoserine phosphatase)